MGTIANLTNRFKALNFDLIKQESLRETAPLIIPEMTREQMRQGQRSDGNPIVPKLEDIRYAIDKEANGGLAPFLTPDLFHTGEFQENIITTITAKTIKTFSIDLKAPKLELRYTPLIYGANSANLAKYATENLQPVLLSRLKAATVG